MAVYGDFSRSSFATTVFHRNTSFAAIANANKIRSPFFTILNFEMTSSSFNDKHSALRFADVGALSKRMLAPIDGYEKAPLVSLEEAVKPLVNIVPKIERNVYVVQENCQNQEDGLTTDESASIMLYTQFEVTSCLNSGHGLHIVQLNELKPKYDLLEPVSVPNSSVQLKKSSQLKSPPTASAMRGQFAAMQLQPQTKSK
ncbi:unnamed protein product, partial [Rotaria magnacalcarata]